MLISSILNFQTTDNSPGNDLPYVLFLPSYTAAAWYHKKLPADLEQSFDKARSEVEQWAIGPYLDALAKGDRLTAQDKQDVIDHLARYTAQSLKDAFDKNPYMKLFVGSGYYDLATPYFATQYTLNHMNLDADQHKRVSLGYYGAGHMMYIQDESIAQLKKDVSAFMGNALK